jgi:hypothetical protein
MRALAQEFADLYIREFLLQPLARVMRCEASVEDTTKHLADQKGALTAFLGHYVFARRGKDRDFLASTAVAALSTATARHGDGWLGAMDPAEAWEEFVTLSKSRGEQAREQQDRGPIQGSVELAQEVERLYPGLSLATWVVEAVRRANVLEPEHTRLVDIRGIGPKTASSFVRDVVVLHDLEGQVAVSERIFMLTVDRWLRAVLPLITDEPGLEDAPDWIIAGKVAKFTRMANVSACRFDMGVTYFGQRKVGRPERFAEAFLRLEKSDPSTGFRLA